MKSGAGQSAPVVGDRPAGVRTPQGGREAAGEVQGFTTLGGASTSIVARLLRGEKGLPDDA